MNACQRSFHGNFWLWFYFQIKHDQVTASQYSFCNNYRKGEGRGGNLLKDNAQLPKQ